MTSDHVALFRRGLLHPSNSAPVSRARAEQAVAINQVLTRQNIDVAGWRALFVELMSLHILRDEGRPGVIEPEQAGWLQAQIMADGCIDSCELELLVHLCGAATAACPVALNQFILDAVRDAVLVDNRVCEADLEMLRKVIYGGGGLERDRVARSEGDLLFDINSATSEVEGHAPGWQSFFITAISDCVFGDQQSPGKVDEEEATWLIRRSENSQHAWWAEVLTSDRDTPSEYEQDPSGWRDFTPPASLEGWTRIPIAPDSLTTYQQWSVDEGTGVITCQGDGAHEWLRYNQMLGDFVWYIEWRVRAGAPNYNSGVGVRMSPMGEIYYQAQTTPRGGYLFGDTIKDGLVQRVTFKNPTSRHRIKPAGEWNVYEIRCRGMQLSLWANGVVVNRWDNIALRAGHVALEAENYFIQFRNSRIKRC